MAPNRRAPTKTYSRRHSNRSLAFDLAAKRPATTLQTAKPTAVAKKTSAKKTKSSGAPPKARAAVADASPGFTDSKNYDQDDELVGWQINRSSHRVFILTLRSTDKSRRRVPEKTVQQKTPSKLDAYWRAFDQPREKTLNTDHYHVFDILAYDPSRGLKIQWVGYGSSDADTTWEPVKKVNDMEPDLVEEFIEREGLDKELKGLL